MRIGLDLRGAAPDEVVGRAREADRLGLWAVLIDGSNGTAAVAAGELASLTDDLHLAVWLDVSVEHPFTLAEEVAVVDHLSHRRALVVAEGSADSVDHLRRLLAGEVVDGVMLAPPPAQTAVPVWNAAELHVANLTGDLDTDRLTIDAARDRGVTHLVVTWPGEIRVLARHLASRAAATDFPQIVADYADRIDP